MVFGLKPLSQSPEAWRDVVGVDKWVPTRSAYELAQKWYSGALPPRVRSALRGSGVADLQSLSVECMFVEHATFLDSSKAPSRTDIMVHCRTPDRRPVVIGVEGKADESFDERVVDWIAAANGEPAPTRLRRLLHLCQMLGVEVPVDSPLRYQLIHRTASIVSEAVRQGAATAVVLVHSFAELPEDNWNDFQAFLRHLGVEPTPKNSLTGACLLGPKRDMPTHFVWVADEVAPSPPRPTL